MMISRRRGALVAAAVATLAATPFLVAARSAHGTSTHATAVMCGATVTTSVTLSGDMSCGSSDGIDVGANGITINLNGHTIVGGGGNVGVNDSGHTAVTVQNGLIRAFTIGVEMAGASSGSKVSNVNVETSGTGILVSSDKVNVTGVKAIANATGFSLSGSGDQLTRSLAEENSGNGIALVAATGLNVTGNASINNTNYGLFINGTATGTVSGNVVNGNGSDGISVGLSDEPFGSGVKLSANRAAFNAGYGIVANPPEAVDGGGNVVQANGNATECAGVVCHAVTN